jgi:hypothetical protein
LPDKRNERVIISDTSCLISLTNINRLDLLQKTYNEIIVTPEVAKEYGTPLPIWIKVMPVKSRARISEIHKNLDNVKSQINMGIPARITTFQESGLSKGNSAAKPGKNKKIPDYDYGR